MTSERDNGAIQRRRLKQLADTRNVHERHRQALYTARARALSVANVAALTTYKTPEDGKDNEIFRREYVRTFDTVYRGTMHQ